MLQAHLGRAGTEVSSVLLLTPAAAWGAPGVGRDS